MLVALEQLEHRYHPEGELVIKPLSHEFKKSTLTAITGPSGSGKSTLLYIMALMLTPSGGVIRWGNENVHALPDYQRSQLRAKYTGFVFQDAVLDLAQTALDNVLEAAWLAGMSPKAARQSALALLERLGIAERASHRPGEVSGGQAQRIALCRALVKSPSIIFADEPTGNLDGDSAAIVWRTLHEAAADGATVIVATHDVAFAETAPRHLRLSA